MLESPSSSQYDIHFEDEPAEGARGPNSIHRYTASLLAGNVVLASDSSLSPTPGTFTEEVIKYTSGENPAQLGLPLQIFVTSKGTGQVSVNNISLTAKQ